MQFVRFRSANRPKFVRIRAIRSFPKKTRKKEHGKKVNMLTINYVGSTMTRDTNTFFLSLFLSHNCTKLRELHEFGTPKHGGREMKGSKKTGAQKVNSRAPR